MSVKRTHENGAVFSHPVIMIRSATDYRLAAYAGYTANDIPSLVPQALMKLSQSITL
jgi:hypothetical protein